MENRICLVKNKKIDTLKKYDFELCSKQTELLVRSQT